MPLSPEAWNVISDAIKILGPAIISAVVAYRVAKIQLGIKAAELDKAHSFAAHEHLFNLYKERHKMLGESQAGLSKAISSIIEGAISIEILDDEKLSQLKATSANSVGLYARRFLLFVGWTKGEMDKHGLTEDPAYGELDPVKAKVASLEIDETDLRTLSENLSVLEEAYSLATYCHELILEQQLDKVFSKYLES